MLSLIENRHCEEPEGGDEAILPVAPGRLAKRDTPTAPANKWGVIPERLHRVGHLGPDPLLPAPGPLHSVASSI